MRDVCPNAVPEGRIIRIFVLRFGTDLGPPPPEESWGAVVRKTELNWKESINSGR